MNKIIVILILLISFNSCQEKKEEKLKNYSVSIINLPLGEDSIIKKIPEFEFTNQMGNVVTKETFSNKIYVADFFFTSCPGICLIMTKNMLKIYEKHNENLKFLSFSIDPKRDSVQKLNKYANKIGINNDEVWHFVTGEKKEIKQMTNHFMVLAYEDSTVAGGIEHGGQFILIDKNQHVRGYYDGTDDSSIEILLEDIDLLLKEN